MFNKFRIVILLISMYKIRIKSILKSIFWNLLLSSRGSRVS